MLTIAPRRSTSASRARSATLIVTCALALGIATLPACDRSRPLPTTTSKRDAAPVWSGPPLFVDVTDDARLDVRHRVTASGRFVLPEIMGSGLAVFDADGDDDLDILFLDAGETRRKGATNRLFLRGKDGHYTEAPARDGLARADYSMGAAVGDLDNDGDLDVYIGNWGRDTLLLNRGDGTFEDATDRARLSGDAWTTSVALLDFDRDGFLDIYVVRYVDMIDGIDCSAADGRDEYCSPNAFNGVSDALLRNRGNGTFEDVSRRIGLRSVAANGLGVIVDDFDDDGFPDVFVANDGEPNQLWINRDGKKFVDEGLGLGVAVNGAGKSEASMGVAVGDVDLDGDLDLFMTHLARESNTLYRRESTGFVDASYASGLHGPSLRFTGFGTAFFDYDNDGDDDLAVVNGRVTADASRLADVTDADPFAAYREPNQLFRNDGRGRFEDVSAGTANGGRNEAVSRGLAAVDLDRDGDLDLVVTNCGGRARIYENRTEATASGNHWLRVHARGAKDGRDAIGARIVVRAGKKSWRRTVGSSSSYLTSVADAVHYGLGAANVVDGIDVTWPDGSKETYAAPQIDTTIVLIHGMGEAR